VILWSVSQSTDPRGQSRSIAAYLDSWRRRRCLIINEARTDDKLCFLQNHLLPSTAVLLIVVTAFIDATLASGAGRVFPMESENLAIEKFQSINPSIVSILRMVFIVSLYYKRQNISTLYRC